MSSESTSQQQVTEISAESGEQILSLLQVQGEEGSGHETIQLVTTTGDGEGIDGQETLLLQPAIEVNGERHVILQQAQDPNTGEVLVFLQGENGETVCLPPEALNANIVQMGDGSGQVYTLALPSDADGSSVVVVSESDGAEGGGGGVDGGDGGVTEETLGNVIAATSSAGTIDLAGTIESIVTSGETFNIEQLANEAASLASSSTSGTQVVQSVVGPLMATTVTSTPTATTTTESESTAETDTTTATVTEAETSDTKTENQGSESIAEASTTEIPTEESTSTVTTTEGATETTTATATTTTTTTDGSSTTVEEISSISNSDDINSKLNEAVSKLREEEDKEIVNDKSESVDTNNMNYGSAVIQVQDANSTTSFDSLVANAMLAAGENNYVIMTTGEDGELPKEINLADVINAGSASGQTIFLQTSEGLVACQAATTGEDGSLQIVADGSGNAIAVSTSSDTSFSETNSGQTLAYTLSSTSSGIELTPVTSVVSTPNTSSTSRNNQLTSVSSRSRFSRQTKPRSNIPTPTSTLASSSSSLSSATSSLTSLATAATTIGETLLLPSKQLVSSSSLNHSTSNNNNINSSGTGFMINSSSINMNTNSRRRTLTNRGRSNISVSITSSSTASTSSLSTSSSSPIIPVQPDAIHSSSSDFSTLTTKSSASSETTTDSSFLTEGVPRSSQLAASRRTYSKKNNIVWLNPETTTITKRSTSTTSSSNTTNANSKLNDGKEESGDTTITIENNNDSKMIDLPVETMNDITLTTTTSTGISNSPSSATPSTTSFPSSSKLTVKPPTTSLTVSNVPTLRSTKRVSEPIIKSSSATSISSTSGSVTPLSPSKSTASVSAMVSKDYSRVISTNVDKITSLPLTSSSGVPSMIKVGAVPQLGRVVTPPVKVTSPVKPNSPIKITSPTIGKITSPTLKVSSPTKIGSPSKTHESSNDFDLDFGVTDGGGNISDSILSPSQSPSKRVTSPIKTTTPSVIEKRQESGSGSESEPFVRKTIDFDALIAATNPNKASTKINQQSSKQNDLSETNRLESDTPKTRSRKRLSESESGNEQSMLVEDNVKTPSHSESGTPLKKRVNFALADSGDHEMILSSSSITKDSQSTSSNIASETPNTRSRKRKSDIETISDLSDQIVPDNNILTFTSTDSTVPTLPSTPTVACTPPPKKRMNIALAQSNDDNDLFATPLSPVKSPKRDDHQSAAKGASLSVIPSTPTGSEAQLGSIVDTPISETRSTRSSRKRRSENDVETTSSADEGSSMKEDIFSSATPSKKRVNFAPGTTIEVIGDDEDDDGDGDDDDSDSVDEKKKEKRLSGRKRTPVNRPSLSSSLGSPQPILKVHKRVDSQPLLLHFGSDDGGESEGGGEGGGEGSEGEVVMKGLLESRGPSEYFDFTINGCCFHIRHQSGRLTPFSPNESEGNYACLNNCGYRTSRMNNIILHNKDQCTVIKMQWQSEIQHLINRQRLMNQDESNPSTPITSPKATTSTTPITNDTENDNEDTTTPSSPIKSPTMSQEEEEKEGEEGEEGEEEKALSPAHSSSSPTHEPLAPTSETEATTETETEATTETPETPEIETSTTPPTTAPTTIAGEITE